MPIELPDVNVLLSLFDPMHPHHDRANEWYTSVSSEGWATCPLTENGFVRILSSHAYPGVRLSVGEALLLLEAATTNPVAPHHFWSDSVTLSDKTLVKPTEIIGAKQITDIYLLALCQRNGGTLVTFDTAISLLPIIQPHPNLIQILTPR